MHDTDSFAQMPALDSIAEQPSPEELLFVFEPDQSPMGIACLRFLGDVAIGILPGVTAEEEDIIQLSFGKSE